MATGWELRCAGSVNGAAPPERAGTVVHRGEFMQRSILAIALGLAATACHAQDFPARAINLIVPNPPGGMNQIHAQPLGAVIEKIYKQPAPVLNKPGGTAAAGTAFVANQQPDGYNVLVTTPNIYLAVEKDKVYGIDSPYKLEQLAPVALLSADPLTITVQIDKPIKTIAELIAAAKVRNGEMSFSSSGPYSITHVPLAMFLDAAGIKMRHVPTTGGGPAVIQLLGGHVDTTMQGLGTVSPHVKGGKLRVLALSSLKRSPTMPDAPTLKEAGYDVEAYLWVGLFATGGTPDATMTKLRDVVRKAVADPAFQDAMRKAEVVVDYRDATTFKEFFDADYKRLAGAVKKIGKI
jgi:tripartite-type tricarboxylate transporter receptor subunit TctC